MHVFARWFAIHLQSRLVSFDLGILSGILLRGGVVFGGCTVDLLLCLASNVSVAFGSVDLPAADCDDHFLGDTSFRKAIPQLHYRREHCALRHRLDTAAQLAMKEAGFSHRNVETPSQQGLWRFWLRPG